MPDWSVFPEGKHISVSQAKLCHQCMFAWKCRYVDKIKKPKSRIMEMGILFDALCNGENIITDSIVNVRYDSFKSHFNLDGWKQFPIWLPITGTDYHVIGFADLVEVDENNKPTLVVDHKFAEKPWTDFKYDTNKIQAQTYLAAMQYMGHDINKFQFRIANVATTALQQFPAKKPYIPRKNTLTNTVQKYYNEAIGWIEAGWMEPEFNDLCEWDGGKCNYKTECEKYLSKGLKTDAKITETLTR